MLVNNILFNTLSRLVNLSSHYLFIPVYIYFLGIEGYGVIGIYIVLFSFLTFTDFGMTATITRQMALNGDKYKLPKNKKTIFSTFEITYFLVCVSLFALGLIFLEPISSIFFNQSQGIVEDKTNIFFLISLALLFQLPSSLYIGALMGLEKQFTANTLISIAAVSRGILAISFLYMESSLESFFLSQILVNICYLIFLRIAVMRNFTSFKKTKKFDVQVIKDNLAFSSNMALLSILGVILINSDKLLVASLLSLKDVGVYTLAFNLSMLPIMLCQIISISCYPTIIKEVEEFQESRFKEFYEDINSLLATFLIPLSLTLIFFNYHISFAWIGSVELSKDVYFYSIILIAAQSIQGTTMLAYYFALSREVTRPQILIATFSVIMLLPVMYFSIGSYGLYGASYTLFFCILISYPFGIIYLNKNSYKVSLSSYSVMPYMSTLLILLPIFFFLSYIPLDPFASRTLDFLLIIAVFFIGLLVATIKNYTHLEKYILLLKSSLKSSLKNNF